MRIFAALNSLYNPLKKKIKMETVENKYITVAYKLYSIEDGEKEFTEETAEGRPFQFISGVGMTLEAFEAQVSALKPGDTFDFVIPAAQAYGEYDDDHVIELPKSAFEVEGKFDSERVVEGNVLPMMTMDGQRLNGLVKEVQAAVVVMDMNHPLAGCDLNFIGSIVESRPATNEELAEVAQMMSGGCGCGSEGCGCGDGCDGGDEHGDSCGCGGGCGCH
jgi:FKBP-type peptidyl-prolyl cis-trans isomerase SlyD